jgi:hypothetical protein
MAVSGANIYIIYEQEWNGIYQLYLSYSRDYGNTWVRNIKLTDSTKNVFEPSISVENENIYIAWVDRRDGGKSIYFKRSSDYGVTWDTSQRITSIGGCTYPEIATNAYWVHAVWWKSWGTLTGDDIFYQRHEVPQGKIEATIDIDPNTLNLKSKGRWITVYIELPVGHNVNDVNISTVVLEGLIPCEDHPAEIGDHNKNGISDLMVKFDRADVEDILNAGYNIEIGISGTFINGMSFQGQDSIRVI